jgi:hypothetical protein
LLSAAALGAAVLAVLQLTVDLVDPVVALVEVELLDQVQTLGPECNQTYQECLALLDTVSEAEITHLLPVTQGQAVAEQVLLAVKVVMETLLPVAQVEQALLPGHQYFMLVVVVVVAVDLQTQQAHQAAPEAAAMAVMRSVIEAA